MITKEVVPMGDFEYIATYALPCRWCNERPTWGDLVIDVLGCKCGVVFGIDRSQPPVTIIELVSEWNKRLGESRNEKL